MSSLVRRLTKPRAKSNHDAPFGPTVHEAPPGLVWHWTGIDRVGSMLGFGGIRVATAGVPEAERPGVWLTLRSDFEPTANSLCGAKSLRGIHGIVRIGVLESDAPLTWDDWLATSGVDPATAVSLRVVAERDGADVGLWRVSYDPLPVEFWQAVHIYSPTRKRWEDWTAEVLASYARGTSARRAAS